MIHASASDLRQAFHKHYSAVQETKEDCSNLLLFYAVECGLKSILLKRQCLKSTAEIQDQTLLSHNFAPLIKALRLPPDVAGQINDQSLPKLPTFHLDKGGTPLNISEAHQAWRYGIRIKTEDQQGLVEWLKKICIWIKENNNR